MAVLVLTALGTAGCRGSSADPEPRRAHPIDVVRSLGAALDARAASVRLGRPAAFDRLLGGGPAFRAAQRTWFANLAQLPVQRLDYRADASTLVRRGSAYWVTVEESLRLRGYDPAPVVRADRWRFRADPRHPGRLLLTSVRAARWEARHRTDAQPWDLGAVTVREGDGVLGVFDRGTVAHAPAVLASVAEGVAAVSRAVPYAWSRAVVVYVLSSPAFLDGLPAVPGHDPEDLDAVAFPVGHGTRFLLNPRMLDRPRLERDRLVRHELTHVALGRRDDHVPVWLAEGVAEWVSVRPVPPRDRRIAAAAVRAAAAGVDDLPADDAFNAAGAAAHYGVAWWAVESLARTSGPEAPWRLLDAMGDPGADRAAVLADRCGCDTGELAHRAARLILDRYRGVSAADDRVR